MPLPDTSRRRAFGQWPWVLPAVLCAAGAVAPPALLVRLNDGAADLLRRGMAVSAPDPRIVIVDVDERSLSALGQWPWRRDRLGALVERLGTLGARAIALDLVLSEPDRAGTPGGEADRAFADTLRRGRVVLGYALTFGASSGGDDRCGLQPLPVTVVEPKGTDGAWPMFEATGAVCSLPALTAAAGASGFLNATPDSDGILRRMPLSIQMRGRVYPSLGLSAALAMLETPASELRAVNANASSLTIGDRTVALDGRANLLLRFRGGRRTFPFVSAADVMQARVSGDAFRDKLVFVGATALGTQELVATPHDPRFIGVEVQATVADNLLRGDWLRRPAEAPLVEGSTTLAVAALVAFAAARGGAAGGAVASLVCLAALWGAASWLLGRWGVLLSPVLPSASVVLAGAGVTLATTMRIARQAAVDLQRARADTDAAVRAHGEFLTSVSRELRTPFAALQGYARMIGRGALADDRKAHALAAVERHAAAQTRVIDDLFEASRAAAGRIRLLRQPVDMAAVVRAAADAARPSLDAKHLTIGLDLGAEAWPVLGDAERLRQVVWHLLSNAAKFTPVGGRIDVLLARGTNAGAESVELIVRDTGAGIAAATLPHVFSAGAAAGESPDTRGLGLGLPLVRQLVELHAGTVSAASDGPGRGAEFRVRLPLDREAAAKAPPRLEGVRVIVEDERAGERGRLASALLQAGASVVTAASSQEALTLMRDDTRDVLVVSVGGGTRNGYWLAREALAVALHRGERLAVVAMGSADHADERALLSGVVIDRYLQTPVDALQLVAAVADVARNGSQHAH